MWNTVVLLPCLLQGWCEVRRVCEFSFRRKVKFKYYLSQEKVLRKILEKVFITKKFTQCRTCTLQIDVFEIPDNKQILKLFSKYELLFLDQPNSCSNPSQTLVLQFPLPRAFLTPSSFLSNFALANWNSSST